MPYKPLTDEEKLILNPLCKAIDFFRSRKGISRTQLAKKAGVGKQTLLDILNGKRRPSYLIINYICAALEIPVFALEVFSANLSKDEMKYWFQFGEESQYYSSTYLEIDLDTKHKIKYNQESK